MTSATQLTSEERLLWTALKKFEVLALSKYESDVPSLATTAKKDLVAKLLQGVPDDQSLAGTKLDQPLTVLLNSAAAKGETGTLMIQGLVLEPLGEVIYSTFGESDKVSATTKTLCGEGLTVSKETIENSADLIRNKIGSGEVALQAFVSSSAPVLKQLAGLGDSIDLYFREPFGITFADLIGEYAAELIPNCTALGMDRRKVVAFLTASLMAI